MVHYFTSDSISNWVHENHISWTYFKSIDDYISHFCSIKKYWFTSIPEWVGLNGRGKVELWHSKEDNEQTIERYL